MSVFVPPLAVAEHGGRKNILPGMVGEEKLGDFTATGVRGGLQRGFGEE